MQIANDPGWSPGDTQKASNAICSLQEARTKCVEEMGATLRRRQKQKPQEIPRWMEVDHDFMDYLDTILPDVKMALQLSEVQGGYDGIADCMTIGEGRSLHAGLAGYVG